MDVIDLYLSGLSIPDVSKKTGIALSTIRFRLKKAGVLRKRGDAVRMAAKEGKLCHMKGKKRLFTDEWKKNIGKSKLGKGKGFSKKPSGYIEITMGENKGRLQHVLVVEKIIGRRLMANECVHHKDEDKTNNDPSNLQLMTKSDHASHHAKENIKNRNRDSIGRLI